MSKRIMTPPVDDDALENKLVALALKQAQQQLEDQTASSQIVTHFLRLASRRAEVELQKLELENQLIREKIAAEQSGQKLGEMVQEVLSALRSYSYLPPGEDDVNIF